ncbi:MAG: iron response transcriptional regulator IrrA [Pseudomonadales bacterium]
MSKEREQLKQAGLRPTRQRLSLLHLLSTQGDRHVTPEQLHEEARAAKVKVSLATVYNSLNQFTAAGLLRQVTLSQGRTFFDTNTTNHHHFFDEQTQQLIDLPAEAVNIAALPIPPVGKSVTSVDVIVRIK